MDNKRTHPVRQFTKVQQHFVTSTTTAYQPAFLPFGNIWPDQAIQTSEHRQEIQTDQSEVVCQIVCLKFSFSVAPRHWNNKKSLRSCASCWRIEVINPNQTCTPVTTAELKCRSKTLKNLKTCSILEEAKGKGNKPVNILWTLLNVI